MPRFLLGVLATFLTVQAAALGQCDPNVQPCIRVQIDNNGPPPFTTTLYFQPSSPSITVPIAAATTDVRIHVFPFNYTSTTDMPRVALTGWSSSTNVWVVLGSGLFPLGDSPQTPVCRDWGGLDISGTPATVRFAGAISGNLSGSITTKALYRFQADGQLRASITASSGSGFFAVYPDGGTTTAGTLTNTSGGIKVVSCVSSTINGNISASSDIGTIEAANIAGGIESTGGKVFDIVAGSAVTSPYIKSHLELRKIETTNGDISSAITIGDATTSGSFLHRLSAGSGSFTGSLSAQGLGDPGVSNDGLFVMDGQLNADITVVGNVKRPISVTGTVTGGIAVPANRRVKVTGGLQSAGSLDLDGQLRGQIILNAGNGTQVWSGPTAINGHTIAPDANFEFGQTSADLGGGAIGMAPFRVWASDCNPVSKDNDVIAPGDGLFVTDLSDANTKPIKVRFYGPIKKGAGYATWKDAFWIECRPLTRKDQDPCAWYPADGGFEIEGPSDTEADVTLARTISIGRAASVYPKPGIYRVIPKMNAAYEIDSVLSRDVSGEPATVWHRACGTPLALSGDLDPPSDAPAYVFRIIPNCDAIDGDTRDDELQDPPPDCSTGCPIADANQSGMVSVQDIFDFLSYYFAGDHRADVNDSGAVSVQDLFDFLAAYFSCQP